MPATRVRLKPARRARDSSTQSPKKTGRMDEPGRHDKISEGLIVFSLTVERNNKLDADAARERAGDGPPE